MSTETAEILPQVEESKSETPTLVARAIGVFTIAWVYFAATDLRWLMHLHAVHIRITRAPFDFNYNGYLACNIANVAASVATACLLLFLPSRLLEALTPKSRSVRSLNYTISSNKLDY